ncbi:MAG: glycoside hydrolase family 97 N-terminal domain-containing protein, partial [Paludibacteraceae bacterium]|nr:glycoside hydrolase family 97 N-terminal domain-containing protein [Paludibacteraceae bacterium]
MKRAIFILSAIMLGMGVYAQSLSSPNGELKLNFKLDKLGRPTYNMEYKGKQVMADSHLGLLLKDTGAEATFSG